MSHNKIKVNFDKVKLTKDLKAHFLQNYTDYMSDLTKRLMAEMVIYVDGFVCCLMLMGEEPMREDDIHKLLLDVAIKWVKLQIHIK